VRFGRNGGLEVSPGMRLADLRCYFRTQSKEAVDAVDEVRRTEWLGDVVESAQFQTHVARIRRHPGRQDHDRNRRRSRVAAQDLAYPDPSISGNMRSSSTRSGRQQPIVSIASLPLEAVRTS